jgi:hypothetical protein
LAFWKKVVIEKKHENIGCLFVMIYGNNLENMICDDKNGFLDRMLELFYDNI